MKVNGIPMRRVNQRYVIATSTKLDISSVKIPGKLDDAYFKRKKLRTGKRSKNIFDDKKEVTALICKNNIQYVVTVVL